jgi:hypothetical protein
MRIKSDQAGAPKGAIAPSLKKDCSISEKKSVLS